MIVFCKEHKIHNEKNTLKCLRDNKREREEVKMKIKDRRKGIFCILKQIKQITFSSNKMFGNDLTIKRTRYFSN